MKVKCYCGVSTTPHERGMGRYCRTRSSSAARGTKFTGAESAAAFDILDGEVAESLDNYTLSHNDSTSSGYSSTSYGGYDSSSSDSGSSSSCGD